MRPICRDFISLLKGKVTKSGYGKPSDRESLMIHQDEKKRKGKLRLKLFLRVFFSSQRDTTLNCCTSQTIGRVPTMTAN
jgi:hypothetical protein